MLTIGTPVTPDGGDKYFKRDILRAMRYGMILGRINALKQPAEFAEIVFSNSKSDDEYEDIKKIITGGTLNFWAGKLAEDFGLSGPVTKKEFGRLNRGQHPVTNEQLVRKTKPRTISKKNGKTYQTKARRGGLDQTISASKSVSLVAMYDKRVIIAHLIASNKTVRAIEKFTQAKMGNVNPPQTTGKAVYAVFLHFESRPDKKTGHIAPNLHLHNYQPNLTQITDGKFRALEMKQNYRCQMLGTAIYRAEMFREMTKIGYEMRTDKRTGAPEVKGISREYILAHSPRQTEIIETANELNIKSTKIVAANYRERKNPDKSEMIRRFEELEKEFDYPARKAAEKAKKRTEEMLVNTENKDAPGGEIKEATRTRTETLNEAFEFAISQAKENKNLKKNQQKFVNRQSILTDALTHSIGELTFDDIEPAFLKRYKNGEFNEFNLDSYGKTKTENNEISAIKNNEIITNFDEKIYQRNLKINHENEKSIRPKIGIATIQEDHQNDAEFDRATGSENLRTTDNSQFGEFGKYTEFISPNQLDKSRSDVVGNSGFTEEIGREIKDFGKEKTNYDLQDNEMEMATRIKSGTSVEETRIIRKIPADLQDDGFDDKTIGSRKDFTKNEIGNIVIGKTDKNTTLRNRQFGAIENHISGAGEESNNGIAEIEEGFGVIFGDRHDAQIGLDQKSSQARLINDESSDEFHQRSRVGVKVTQKTNMGFGNEGNETGEREISVPGNHLDLEGQNRVNFESKTEPEQINKSKISKSQSDNFDGDNNDIAVRGNAYALETDPLSNNSVENTVLAEPIAEKLIGGSISREKPRKIDVESEKNLVERGAVTLNAGKETESDHLDAIKSNRVTAQTAAQIINLKFYNAQLEQKFINEWSSIIEKFDAKDFLCEILTKSKTEDLKGISQTINKQAEFISAKLTMPLPKLQTKSEPDKLALTLAKIETANYELITGEKINPKTLEVLAEKKLSFAQTKPSDEQIIEIEKIFENLPVKLEIASYLEAETLTALINPHAAAFDEEEIEQIQEEVERNLAASREMATLIQLSYGGQADKFTDNFKSDLAGRIYDLPAPATEIYDNFRDFDWQKRGELFSPLVNNIAEQYETEIEFPQTFGDRNNHLTDFVALQIKNAYEIQNEPIDQNIQNNLTAFLISMDQNASSQMRNSIISDLMKNELEPPVFSGFLEATAYIFDNQEIEKTERIATKHISNIQLKMQDEERSKNQRHVDEEQDYYNQYYKEEAESEESKHQENESEEDEFNLSVSSRR